MRRPRSLPVVDYNPHSLPPRTFWKLIVNIPRNTAGTFCERLYLLVAEKTGASMFVPDIENDRNTCRFEWNREWGGDRFGLRVGLTFVAGSGPITELEAYVTTKDLINAANGVVPAFDPGLLKSVGDEIAAMIDFGIHGESIDPTSEWQVVFHFAVPYALGFSRSAEAVNGHFRFIKTRIVPKDLTRLSALLIRCKARSAQAAQQRASAEAMIALALLTLLGRKKYELAPLQWPRSRGFNNVMPAARAVVEERLFPPRRYLDGLEEMEPDVIQRFEELWAAYQRLQDADRTIFTPALLAYYAAVNSSNNYQTISTVGYMASFAALSNPLRQRCEGQLTCSVHGALNWRHDTTSETSAIVETILASCGIDREDQRVEIRKLVNRVYREQRSAFVHSAQLRHAEYSQGSQTPSAMPANDAPTSELFIYQDDMVSIAGIARRTLIEWLIVKSGGQLDRAKMQINTERVTYRSLLTTAATMGPKVITRVATQPVAQSANTKPGSGNTPPVG
jgi:hypothetical protein